MPASEWLTPEQFADEFGISASTVYAWRAQGFGPPTYKIGRSVRLRRDDVEAWLQERVAEPVEPAAAVVGSDCA